MQPQRKLSERLAKKEFVVSIQIDPPGPGCVQAFQDSIRKLIHAGVELVDINSSRRLSHDSIQLSIILAQQGLEVIPHVTTRDSSINGLLNQMLAAYELGVVRNFLVITGDPYEVAQALVPSQGVFQTDAIGALRAFHTHLRGNHHSLSELTLAAAVNQNEKDMVSEGMRLHAKEEAGADFFMSQPVFNEQQIEELFRFYERHTQKPLIVGLWPLVSAKTTEAIMGGRIVGVSIPDEEYREITLRGHNDEALRHYSFMKTHRLIEFLRSSKKAHGAYIVAPLRNPSLLLDFITAV